MRTSWYEPLDSGDFDEETLNEISGIWPGALDITDAALAVFLAAARVQCEAYAPPVDIIPDNYRLAQAFQARALARAGYSGQDQDNFVDMPTMFPMDWTVKRLLNPERRIGGIA